MSIYFFQYSKRATSELFSSEIIDDKVYQLRVILDLGKGDGHRT